jgi:hypothetical protein
MYGHDPALSSDGDNVLQAEDLGWHAFILDRPRFAYPFLGEPGSEISGAWFSLMAAG